jgi:hypothetical protein
MLKGKNAASYLLAVFLLAGATAVRPDTVMCLGPGGHSHLETVVGESCNECLAVPDRPAPRPLDGCPRGSKDFRLGVDTHRNDVSSTVASLASVLAGPAANAPLAISPQLAPNPSVFLSVSVQKPPRSTIVLRC